jgi:hypothetical protein
LRVCNLFHYSFMTKPTIMKTKSIISILLLIAFGTFSSCDLFDKADDVSFDVTLPLDFSINETADNPGGKAYADTKLLDATSNAEVAKYASKIKEFKVNKITYTISSVNPGGVTFNSGTLVVSSSGTTIATAGNVALTNVSDVELSANTAGFNELAANLLDDKQEEVKLQGTFTKTPIAFTLSCKFYVTITANAL